MKNQGGRRGGGPPITPSFKTPEKQLDAQKDDSPQGELPIS